MKSKVVCSADVDEIWDRGVRLPDAWFHLADEGDQERFRQSNQTGRIRNSVEIGLRSDLHARLESGELHAVGVEAGSAAHDGPRLIGRHFFSQDAQIDWSSGEVNSLGIHFLDVRVGGNPDWKDDVCELSISEQSPASLHHEGAPASKRLGRPSITGKIREIVLELNQAGQFEKMTWKQVEVLVQRECQTRYPLNFPKDTTPTRRSINIALREEGLK